MLVLTHRANAQDDIGWNVLGYPSLDGMTRQRRQDELGCNPRRTKSGK